MNDIIARINRLVHELAAQQLRQDDWWKPELASITEALNDRAFERRQRDRRRSSGPKIYHAQQQ
jgi:hypothetical protein